MFFNSRLACLVLVVAADGSIETDRELALARATFARVFPDDAQGHTEIVLDRSKAQRLREVQS